MAEKRNQILKKSGLCQIHYLITVQFFQTYLFVPNSIICYTNNASIVVIYQTCLLISLVFNFSRHRKCLFEFKFERHPQIYE